MLSGRLARHGVQWEDVLAGKPVRDAPGVCGMIVLESFTTGPEECMYLPDRQARLEYEFVARLSPEEYERRMNEGWRKFGHLLFHPVCGACRECRPIRVP